jgi:prepilin-type N-terminal cleavage/methylation domain-containing protein/prepilin-type processing-associated H-X9-DG protein
MKFYFRQQDQEKVLKIREMLRMDSKKNKTAKKGFTLIELLVVISIIALLLSIIMPSLQKAKEQAKKVICRHNLKQFGLANAVYATQNDGWYIPYLGTGYLHWFRNPEMLDIMAINPGEVGVDSSTGKFVFSLSDDFRCPSDRRKDGAGIYEDAGARIEISYGYNMMGLMSSSGTYDPEHNGHKSSQMKQPGQKIAFADGPCDALWFAASDYTLYWDPLPEGYRDWAGPVPGFTNPWNKVSYRHSEGANITFFDGHTEYLKKEKIFKKADPTDYAREEAMNSGMWLPTGSVFNDRLSN